MNSGLSRIFAFGLQLLYTRDDDEISVVAGKSVVFPRFIAIGNVSACLYVMRTFQI